MKKIFLIGLVLLVAGYVYGEVPSKINYQGRLIENNVPVHNPTPGVPMIFKVGGQEVYNSVKDGNVPVYNGLFRVELNLKDIDWTAGVVKYLEVTVDGKPLSPPEPLYAYPYAINTHFLEGKTTAHFLDVSGSTQTKQGGLNIMGRVGIGKTNPRGVLDIRNSLGPDDWGSIRIGDYVDLGETYLSNLFYLGINAHLTTSNPSSGNKFTPEWPAGQGMVMAQSGGGVGDIDFYGVNWGGSSAEKTFPTDFTHIMRLTYDGKVGIGTTGPGKKLDVAGSIAIAEGASIGPAGYVHASGHDNTISFGQESGQVQVTNYFDGSYNNQYITFSTHHGGISVGERMRIDRDGNVGIGTPPPGPGSKLDVRGITQITDDGAAPDTSPYASFGVTRANVAQNNAYIGLTKQGNVPWGMGIDSGSSLILGVSSSNPPRTIPTPALTITTGGNVGISGNLRATGGIEPDWDSGWVYYARSSPGLKKLTHNLNSFPRQIQWWFSPGNPGSWIGPVAWSKEDHWSNPIGVWVTLTEIKFTIWGDRDLYRAFNGTAWEDYITGYYRILLWK